jgi:hypothetical protein
MLDHAARRVSATHSWIKLNELRRQQFAVDAEKINRVPPVARAWLHQYCDQRSAETGAADAYRIRRRAHQGWKQIVETWAAPPCTTEEDRIAAARDIQGDPEIRFGDIQLFEALAAEDAIPVWGGSHAPDPEILLDYAAAVEARFNQSRFKIPRYCHPDPLLHPVFCDFGNSRWKITFAAHDQPADEARLRRISMELFTGSGFQTTDMLWHSKRLPHDLALGRWAGVGNALEPKMVRPRLCRTVRDF